MPFEFSKTEIPDVILVRPKLFEDERGMFAEIFKLKDFEEMGIVKALTQVNFSSSKKNVLRGLHYQNKPKAQAKLVSCARGEVFDVAVDIRVGSPTYGAWVAETLTAQDKNMLYIPAGFAHGFCALVEDAELIYFCDEQYSPDHEAGIVWNDSDIGITWPMENPVLAERDAAFPPLADADNTFTYG